MSVIKFLAQQATVVISMPVLLHNSVGESNKRTSLLCQRINYECKKFYDTSTWGLYSKTFFDRNKIVCFSKLQCLSLSVTFTQSNIFGLGRKLHLGWLLLCQNYKIRVDVTDRDKHSSLLRYRFKYGRKIVTPQRVGFPASAKIMESM